MIQLGAVELNKNMIWEDRYSYSPIRQEVDFTLGGSLVVYAGAVVGARPITLVAIEDQGWLTKDQADAVYAMCNQVGTVYTLTIGAESFSVIFRHHDAPAVSFSPLIPRATPLTGDYFTGYIRLLTV